VHLAGDLEVLAGGDDERVHAATGGGHVAVAVAIRVAARVDADAEEPEAVGRPGAHRGGVLADATAEDQRVEAAHRGGHRGDPSAQVL